MMPNGPRDETAAYRDQGWWPGEPVAELVRRRAGSNANGVAYLAEDDALSWAA